MCFNIKETMILTAPMNADHDDDLNANHMRGVSSITMFMREVTSMKPQLLGP